MTAAAALAADYRAVNARSLMRESVLVDPWFLGRFGLNLYRGCEHGCLYCDGRAERYYVEGDFARDIIVKGNALELADLELTKRREPGFLFLGGGVSDSYQPAEAHYRLARGILERAAALHIPIHVLTKSALVERDFDLLQTIHQRGRAVVSFSLQTTDDALRQAVEPRASSVTERLRLLAQARALGMHGGIMAMPILPGLSDTQAKVDDLVQQAADHGAEFVCFGSLTLRPGRQKQAFYDFLHTTWPTLVAGYDRAYGRNLSSGAADRRFSAKVLGRFAAALSRAHLPCRIPRAVFAGVVPRYTEASVLLEHAEAAAQLQGVHRPLGHAGHALAQWARARVVKLGRRRHFEYGEVEAEFAARMSDGSLTEIEGVSPEAFEQLQLLGF
jgi:DNA repair photolyase